MLTRPKAEAEVTTDRLEAFSDGVFAIAITLLVLEIKAPARGHSGSPAPDLAAALLNLWPSYFGYVFSFVMIGIHWAHHHYIFRLYERSTHNFLLLNIFYLMCISFLPFPTAVLAQYITSHAHRQIAIILYCAGLFLPAFASVWMWLYASRNHRLVNKYLDDGFIAHLTRRYLLTIALYIIAILLSWWHGNFGLLLCIGLALMYLLPSRAPVFNCPP